MIDLKNSSVAYLAAWNCATPDATPVFFSHYINLTLPENGAPASSSSAAAAVTQSSTASPSPLIGSSSFPSHSFYSSAVIGGGIGGGVGGAFVLLVACFVLSRYRKARKDHKQRRNQLTSSKVEPQGRQFRSELPVHGQVFYSSHVPRAELSSDASTQEKPLAELSGQSIGHPNALRTP